MLGEWTSWTAWRKFSACALCYDQPCNRDRLAGDRSVYNLKRPVVHNGRPHYRLAGITGPYRTNRSETKLRRDQGLRVPEYRVASLKSPATSTKHQRTPAKDEFGRRAYCGSIIGVRHPLGVATVSPARLRRGQQGAIPVDVGGIGVGCGPAQVRLCRVRIGARSGDRACPNRSHWVNIIVEHLVARRLRRSSLIPRRLIRLGSLSEHRAGQQGARRSQKQDSHSRTGHRHPATRLAGRYGHPTIRASKLTQTATEPIAM
jgi:hypothetical protein